MYDFDRVPSRLGTGSLKWDDCAPGELPLWVADMDFPAAPEIRAAIEKRAAHGVFGYNIIPDSWYDAYVSWWRDRHGMTLDRGASYSAPAWSPPYPPASASSPPRRKRSS